MRQLKFNFTRVNRNTYKTNNDLDEIDPFGIIQKYQNPDLEKDIQMILNQVPGISRKTAEDNLNNNGGDIVTTIVDLLQAQEQQKTQPMQQSVQQPIQQPRQTSISKMNFFCGKMINRIPKRTSCSSCASR